MIAETVAAVQTADFVSMTPYRTPPDDLDQACHSHRLVQTARCIESELRELGRGK
jgi:hypothetical protein